jgi:CHAT domain-containing protein/Flp pilus assembly protein TadD
MREPLPGLVLLTLAVLVPVAISAQMASPLDEQLSRAQALQKKGEAQDALRMYESLLPELRSSSPSNQLGLALAGISQISLSVGDYAKAIQTANSAAEVYRSLGDASDQARALNDKSIAEIEHGDYSAALGDLANALRLSRQVRDAETEVKTLNNQGSAYFYQGKYQEAQRCYQNATQLVEQNAAKAWAAYWKQISDFNQATLYQRLGRYENALNIYRGVKDSAGQQLGVSDRAHLFTNLGALYRRLGDAVKAVQTYQAALQLYARQRDDDGEIGTLKNIGIVNALDLGDMDEAQKYFEKAFELARKSKNRREEMQAHLYRGEVFVRKGEWSRARQEFQTALSASQALETTEEQWKAWYGLGRVEELRGTPETAESDYRQAITIIESTRAQLQLSALRAEFFADKRDVYDALLKLLFAKADVAGAFSVLERSRARTFQDRLSRSAQTVSPMISEVQERLDGATILLEFWSSQDYIGLIWCTRSEYGILQQQLSQTDMANVRGLLRDFPNNMMGDWRQQIAVLRKLLPTDISFLGDLKHAFIVPDGWLGFVPFELFPITADSLFIDRFDISYLPTAALLERRPVAPKIYFPWSRELVAFAKPSVASQPRQSDGVLDDADPLLPYSAEEVNQIAAMTNGKSDLLVGPANSKHSFFDGRANSALLLHVSTHAVADTDNPENSRLLFSPDVESGAAEYVYLRELYDLDLSHVNLATLSACDTERGKMVRGEGVQAFSRALLSAGARASLTTLGRVDDQVTAEFMEQFYYFALKKRQSKAEALRSAKLKFLHSGTRLENPGYWAAFVLNGEGLAPVPMVISWTELAAFGAAILLTIILLGLFLRYLRRVHR